MRIYDLNFKIGVILLGEHKLKRIIFDKDYHNRDFAICFLKNKYILNRVNSYFGTEFTIETDINELKDYEITINQMMTDDPMYAFSIRKGSKIYDDCVINERTIDNCKYFKYVKERNFGYDCELGYIQI